MTVIETQTRFGGDQIWEMVQLTTGRSLAAETVAAMLDASAPDPAPAVGGAAIRFLPHEHAQVTHVGDADAIRARPGVVRVDLCTQPGQKLGPLVSSWSRQGYVLGTGTTEAVVLVEQGVADFDIRVTPHP